MTPFDVLVEELRERLGLNDIECAAIQQALTQYHQDMMSEVVEKIKSFDHNNNHLCRFNDAPQKCECYYAGIETAQTIIKSK